MKYMGFQIVFNILKTKKKPTNWLANYTFACKLRKRFWRHFFGRITKATMVHHLTPKKAHWWINFFSKFILLIYFRALLAFPVILAICYFRVLWACHRCLTTPKANFIIVLQLLWISYYMQKANFLPQIVFEIFFEFLSYNIITAFNQFKRFNSFHYHDYHKHIM